MWSNRMVWGGILIVAGILFLLNTLGILSVSVWGIIWPLFLILVGIQFLTGVVFRPHRLDTQALSIPLDTANEANIQVHHGAGQLQIGPGAGPGELMTGSFDGGVSQTLRRNGAAADLTLRVPSDQFFAVPWFGGTRGFNWDVNLNRAIPITLELHTGASESQIDLTNLQVRELRLETGASNTQIRLPANAGATRVRVSSGAARVRLLVPDQVSARIEVESGLSGIDIDQRRFPRVGRYYESPDYAGAINRVDIHAESGVGSIEVR